MEKHLDLIKKEVLRKLPYSAPFLFVDDFEEISENGIKGSFTFSPDSSFYKGHFVDFPVTPGVILTECMAQIGVVSLGIFLLRTQNQQDNKIALSSTEMQFILPVLPGETVLVVSEKQYFRFGKLKCRVKMYNAEHKLVCSGEIAGIVKKNE